MRNPKTGTTTSVSVLERTNDQLHQRFTERWRFREVASDGSLVREEDELLELRWIFRYEMRHLLELCDFVIEDERSDYLGAPPAYVPVRPQYGQPSSYGWSGCSSSTS